MSLDVRCKCADVPMLGGMSTLGKPLLEVGALCFLQRAWTIEDWHTAFFCSRKGMESCFAASHGEDECGLFQLRWVMFKHCFVECGDTHALEREVHDEGTEERFVARFRIWGVTRMSCDEGKHIRR